MSYGRKQIDKQIEKTEVNDVLILIGQFGSPGTADLDGDGTVDSDDLLLLLASWGVC